jgi:NADH dehydrogenase [ubiquinone] 1 alpha subcomplex assembly factor 1
MHCADAASQDGDMSKVLFDFTEASAVQAWTAIDDRVMGGVSRSSLQHDPAGHAVFKGTVSLERNGGFASVRSSPADRSLRGATSYLIEVRGDHKQFKLSALTDGGFDTVNYQVTFTPAGSAWQTLNLLLSEFHATFRGRAVSGAPPLDPARIRQVGLMIAAGQAGPFELHIRAISLA